MVAIEYK